MIFHIKLKHQNNRALKDIIYAHVNNAIWCISFSLYSTDYIEERHLSCTHSFYYSIDTNDAVNVCK